MRAKAVWAGAPLGALDLPWCAAASGVLRSLPALSELVQRRGAMLRDAAQSLTPLLSLFAVGAASCTCREAGHLVRRSSKQDPQLAQFSTAVFQLHTDCCRAAHCSSDPLLGVIPPANLIRTMSHAMLAADSLASVPAGSAPLKAMATAHCATVRWLLSSPGRVQELASGLASLVTVPMTMIGLAAALCTCPQAASLDNELPTLLAQLIDESVQVRAQRFGVGRRRCMLAFLNLTNQSES